MGRPDPPPKFSPANSHSVSVPAGWLGNATPAQRILGDWLRLVKSTCADWLRRAVLCGTGAANAGCHEEAQQQAFRSLGV